MVASNVDRVAGFLGRGGFVSSLGRVAFVVDGVVDDVVEMFDDVMVVGMGL